MTALIRFLAYNLLVGLAAGGFAWLIVRVTVHWLGLRSSTVSFCFFALPVFKSLLLILGVGLIFPWPWQVFETWHTLALPFRQLWPWLLLWAAGMYLIYLLAAWQIRRTLLKSALPATKAAPRLTAAFDSVRTAFGKAPCPPCAEALCCLREARPSPRLLSSEHLDSPLALTEGAEPAILFPIGLITHLDDRELAGALAHEMAHFVLRRRSWCSARTLQILTLINPVASLAGEYLHRQEEKACDDLAVSLLGQPEVYAGMLTKCYRFARQQTGHNALARLYALPRLVGLKPLISERVEHVLARPSASNKPEPSPVIVWLVWAGLVAVLFFSWVH